MAGKFIQLNSGEFQQVLITPTILGALFNKEVIDATHNADFCYSYDIDLSSATANVLTTLPDAADMPGGRIAIKITSFSATYYWQLNTTGGQGVDEYASTDLKTTLIESDALYRRWEFEANTDGTGWNIVSAYSRNS